MFKLRLQFFIVMLIICSLLTAGLYLFIKFSFKQDFWHYIEKKETRFAQPLMNDLVKKYHEEKNWAWIGDWNSYVIAHLNYSKRQVTNPEPSHEPHDWHRDHDATPEPHEHDENKSEDSPDARAFREWREVRHMPPMGALRGIFLLDQHHQLIAGKIQRIEDAFLIPLNDDEDETVGYLGIPFNPAIRDLQDSRFAQGEETKLSVVIAIALIIASLASFPVSYLLTQRINSLVNNVRQLSRGNYREKISVKGRDELSVLAEHLNSLGETLAQSEQTRRQWVADISHELRTPIAVLKAELEAMEDGVRPLDKSAVHRLSKHSQRLTHLVNDLYELSLTDLGGMTYRKNTVDLRVLVQDAVHSMQAQFTQHSIELHLALAPSPVTIFADQDRLQQLLANLLKNSLHYTNAPGKTQVTLKSENHQALLIIEDTAPGVSEEHHAKLFDRLYRADSSRNRATGGAGLGLSICKNIVTAHDGHIAISNSSLGGLKITISFPVKDVS